MCVGLPGQRVEGGGRGGDQEGCQAQGRREHVGHSRRKSSGIDCKSGEDPIRLKTPEPTLKKNWIRPYLKKPGPNPQTCLKPYFNLSHLFKGPADQSMNF